MSEPKMVGTHPVICELEPGTYWWCSCGHSGKHPFCDGAHKGSGIAPVKLEITEKQTVPLCACKQTGQAPRCDGAHKRI